MFMKCRTASETCWQQFAKGSSISRKQHLQLTQDASAKRRWKKAWKSSWIGHTQVAGLSPF